MKDRESKQVTAEVVPVTDSVTLQMFVVENTTQDATVYTDNARAYINWPRRHGIVNHGVGEYIRERIHTNGVESFWATLKRGVMGTYPKMSPKTCTATWMSSQAGTTAVRSTLRSRWRTSPRTQLGSDCRMRT